MQYFSRKDKLVEHKKEVHNGQKFKCKASFTQKDKLKNHFKMGQHKKSLSLHECSICGMKFQRWQERDRHIKEIHSQKKKVKCPECNQIIHRCISVTKCLPTQALSGAMRNKSMQNLASSAKNVQQPTPKLEKHVASGNKSQCRLLLWLLLASEFWKRCSLSNELRWNEVLLPPNPKLLCKRYYCLVVVFV